MRRKPVTLSRPEIERRRRLRRHGLLAAGLLLLAAGFAGLVRQLTTMPAVRRQFAVSRVLSDCPRLSVEHLYGRQLLALDLDVEAARLADDPRLERVRLRKVLPGTLLVAVVRRVPFAWFVDAGGRARLVDRMGVLLPGEVDDHDAATLVRLDGFPAEEQPEAVRALAALEEWFDFAWPPLVVRGPGGFVFTWPDGRRVIVPDGAGPAEGCLLRRVLADFLAKGVTYEYIDLRFDPAVFLPAAAPAGSRAPRGRPGRGSGPAAGLTGRSFSALKRGAGSRENG